MPRDIASKDLKTLGIVLRRTNYGEADRILNLITPVGKISVIAKGVRRAKSKLAGGVEMFTLAEMNIHRGRSDLGVVTSAKMRKHYSEILKDYGRMELMALILRKISVAAEHTEGEEYFEITRQCMEEINNGMDLMVVESWFWLNLARVVGEEMNLYRDVDGEKLVAGEVYEWSVRDGAFARSPQGRYGTDEIKMLRLMSKMNLASIKRIRVEPGVMDKVYDIIRIWEN